MLLISTLQAALAAPLFSGFPAKSIGMQQRGGFASLDRWVVVTGDGTVYLQERTKCSVVRKLSAAELDGLHKKFVSTGFSTWPASYSKGPVPPDGMTTVLSCDGHMVSCTDPASPPAAFYQLCKALLAAAKVR